MDPNCPKCGEELEFDKFSDAVHLSGRYFDVYLRACPGCGWVNDEQSYIA